MAEQTVKQAGKAVKMTGKPAVLLPGICFFSKTTLLTAAGYIGRNGRALLPVIVRAKRFAVAYREPEKREAGRKGKKRIYGKKALLTALFEKNRNGFIRTPLVLYGKRTTVQYLRTDLIRKPARQPVRFVLTIIGNSHFILMSASRSLDGETIIRLYARRFKTGGLFGELKNRPGGFGYHFRTCALEKRKKGTEPVLPGDKKTRYGIEMTKKPMETFVFCHCLGYVILTGLALRGSEGIWGRFRRRLRKVRTGCPRIY